MWWNPCATGGITVTDQVRDTGNLRLAASGQVAAEGLPGRHRRSRRRTAAAASLPEAEYADPR